MQFIMTYWKVITIPVSIITLTITIVKIIANSFAINKIQNNEIKHITADIDMLKKDDKDFKKEINNELHDISLSLRRIEKKQTIRDTVCNLRHKKN